ncbi:transcriptional regulator [Streptomonospora sp. S1-112]|uniref:Transcriptional regulator n=1 Tax=Streptomonospora mangrovi TaxID=2883123 RepID=A0A9X3NY83_9ACTN|nr:transcriptional regulator [Streptomonospora mangrovi]MDA0566541.1 transcriptional regulator [Streptomonospora mangrovi]
MSHPRARLDDTIHAPVRFSIMAALAAADEADFRFLRDTVEVSDSALSKQLSTLEGAGYVKVRKTFVGRRPRTFLGLTPHGREAFDRHVEALRDIAAGAGVTPPEPTADRPRPG